MNLQMKMACVRVWIWSLLCSIISSTMSQSMGNQYNWQNVLPLKKIETQPNFVIILADDMGWGDMGANWVSTRDTPNLDALAKGGLRFSDFHSGASVCSPSRAAMLTGRMGLRTGVVSNFGDAALGGLPANETTFAETLRAAGYRTAMFGKWHLGLQPGHHPLDKGFDSYLGVPYSIDMGCTDDPTANLPQCAACPRGAGETSSWRNASAVDQDGGCFEDLALPLIKDRAVLHQPLNLSTLAKQYAKFGEDFISRSAKSSRPFLLYAALAHVHVPLTTGARFANASGRGPLADTLREMDWVVGRLAKAAAALARRAPHRSTLIWFLRRAGVVGVDICTGRAADAGGTGFCTAAFRTLPRRSGHQPSAVGPRQPTAPTGTIPSQQRGEGGRAGPSRRCACGELEGGVLRRRSGDVRRDEWAGAQPAPAAGVRRAGGRRGGAAAAGGRGAGGARAGLRGPRGAARQRARGQHLAGELRQPPLRQAVLQHLQRHLPVPVGLVTPESLLLSLPALLLAAMAPPFKLKSMAPALPSPL